MRVSNLYILLLLAFCTGCRKDNPRPNYPAGSNEQINSWVLDSMKVYYYWANNLPARPDLKLQPSDFFTVIKNPADRFSLLLNPADLLTYRPTLVSAFGLDLVTIENSGNIQTLVLLVVPGSAASRSGIKRGDVVSNINNTQVNSGNAEKLVSEAIINGTLSLVVNNMPDPVFLSSTYPAENPVYTSHAFEKGSQKTGYIFFNSFRSGSISQFKSIFSSFKTANVTELILDMRYNVGGEVSIAALLAAIIAPVNGTDIFIEYRGNAKAGTKRSSFDNELVYISQNVAQLVSYRLPLRRIYLLTGRHTTSSAELFANCLSPYLQVIRMGEKTLGKDMASFEIRDMRNPKQVTNWIINPLVYKLYNSNKQGDYSNGLAPAIAINELENLPLKPFGDETDPLIATALMDISGKQPRLAKSSGDNAKVKITMDTRDQIDQLSNVKITKNSKSTIVENK
ncbi:MAG TPA: S41 family peptidase [Pedobacter sp.]|uniref:S41 family peptidase n=1 Tax=Pedobacter sp. TaxID=1411316 RepID=UPI002BD3ECF3|nr:S41 family peptidase [Pedobacter sp.]HMI03489.1 S41 family peptidase [Pedobacter sp.]